MADLSILVPAENKRTMDWVYGAHRTTAVLTDRAAGLLDNPLHLADTASAALNLELLLTEAARCADCAPYANVGAPTDLTVGMADGPVLRLAESFAITEDPLNAAPAESVRVLDFVLGAARFVASQNTLAAGLMENPLKAPDGPPLGVQDVWATPSERPRVLDFVFGAARNTQTDRASGNLDAPLRLRDSGQVDLIGNEPRLHLADGPPSVFLGAGVASVQDALRLADAVTVGIELLVAVTAEGLRISETSARQLDPLQAAAADEALRVTDTPTLRLDPLQAAAVQEAAKLAEGAPALQLDPLQLTVGTEALKVTETAPAGGADLQAAVGGEALVVAELAAGRRLDPLQVGVGTDSAKVGDAVVAQTDPLLANVVAETGKLADAGPGVAGSLAVSATEALVADDSEYFSLLRVPPDLTTGCARSGFYQAGMDAPPG